MTEPGLIVHVEGFIAVFVLSVALVAAVYGLAFLFTRLMRYFRLRAFRRSLDRIDQRRRQIQAQAMQYGVPMANGNQKPDQGNKPGQQPGQVPPAEQAGQNKPGEQDVKKKSQV